MASPHDHPAIIRTRPPALTRGQKWAIIGWSTFALVLIGGMVVGAFIFIGTLGPPPRSGKPGTNPASPTASNTPPTRGGSKPVESTLPSKSEDAPSTGDWSLNNASFTAPPADPFAPPMVEVLTVPEFPGYSAVWGATGRDHRGHVWLGVSTRVWGGAHLIEFIPNATGGGRLVDRGSVIDQLKRLDLHTKGMTQIKIHSRIEQAADGFLYFTSMDEKGEAEDGSRLPTHGSHLWRIRPDDPDEWEHLAAAPHGLIALATAGQYVYALGYYGHVLYQYDTEAAKLRTKNVGSLGGHTSRNLVVDRRGHAYVPRLLTDLSDPSAAPVAMLVEFNADLKEIASSPLDGYVGSDINQSHGIIALHPLADGSIALATQTGVLHRVTPGSDARPAAVEKLGFFHPQGARYIATMFSYDGKRHIMGIAQRGNDWDWVCFDLSTKTSRIAPLRIEYRDQRKLFKHLLYGSVTRDAAGAFFVVGTDQNLDRPVVLRLSPPR